MKPAQTLFPLLTVAVVGVGHASGQFVTSTMAASGPTPRNSDVSATVAVRQDTDTVRRTVTRTVIQSSRGSSSSSSTRPRTSSSTKNNDDDDDGTTTCRTSKTRSQTSTTPSTTTSKSTSLTNSSTSSPSQSQSQPQSPSETAPPTNQPKPTGLSPGAAAGIAAGAVSLAAIAAAAAFLLWRRRQGGIRGAVVTADYPRGMSSNMSDGDPKLPTPAFSEGEEQGQRQQPYPVVTGNGAMGGETLYKIPPAGTMPCEEGFGHHPGEGYPQNYPQQQQQQQWLSPTGAGEAFTPRPVSAFTTTCPSPGHPVLPVSPLTPYHPRPESKIPMAGEPQHPSRTTSYYPGMDSTVGSPELPTYLIPGGDRSRAVSFSSVPRFGGGGPHVAELVGSPPPRTMPSSMMVVVEGGEEPGRQSHVELP